MSNVHLTSHPEIIAVEMHHPQILNAPRVKVKLHSTSETTEQAETAGKSKQSVLAYFLHLTIHTRTTKMNLKGERQENKATPPFDSVK